MKILIVEDDPLSLDMLSRRLEKRGFAILTATDGAQALRHAREDGVELVITDIGLPKLDGYELAMTIKADSTVSHIPLIALTAHAMKEDEDKILKSGFDAYETKPVNFARLLQKIEYLVTEK